MAALLKTLQRAANDFRPSAPHRRARIVTLSQKHRDLFHDAVIGLLLLVTVMSAAMLWSMHEISRRAAGAAPVPAASVAPPSASAPRRAKIIVKVESGKPAKPLPLPPPPTPASLDRAAEAYPDIVLPADSLQPNSDAEATPAPDSAPEIAVISQKINDPPVTAKPEAEKHFIQLHDARPPHLPEDELLDNAHLLLESGEDQAALGLYDRVLGRDGGNAAALEGKMYALLHTGQYEEAVRIGHRLLQIDPEDPETRSNLIVALGHSYKPESMTELQRMVAANPDNAAARVALARLLMRRGYIEKAFVQLSHAVRIAPDDIAYRLDLAILYDQAGHVPEALTVYREVLGALAGVNATSQLAISPDTIRQRVLYLEALVAADTTSPRAAP